MSNDAGAGFEVIAHRGASGRAPENTLAALELAIDSGARWAEVDVQRTSDGVLVLVHDDTWLRTGGLDRAIAATPWNAVRGLDVGGWFAPHFAGQAPPTLEAALRLESLSFNLEIKSPEHHPDLGFDVVAAVRRMGAAARVLLTSFDAGLVEALADAAPELQFGYLSVRPPERRHARIRTFVLAEDHIVPAWVRERHAEGSVVWAWTVDDVSRAQALRDAGVAAVISNYPERLAGLRRLPAAGEP